MLGADAAAPPRNQSQHRLLHGGDLVVDDPQVCSAHLRVAAGSDDTVIAEDLDSVNGLWTASGERVRRSAEALRALKPDEAKALMMKAHGLSYAEIAGVTGLSATNVGLQLRDADPTTGARGPPLLSLTNGKGQLRVSSAGAAGAFGAALVTALLTAETIPGCIPPA